MSSNSDQEYLNYKDMPDIYNSGSGGQRYGWRIRHGKKQFHHGIDFGVSGKVGVPIGVPEQFNGWYVYVFENNHVDSMGNEVFLVSPDSKKVAKFSHVANGSFEHIKNGMQVFTGDWIGDVGGTGLSEDKDDYALHIHFEYGNNPSAATIESVITPEGEEIETNYQTILFENENPTKILTEKQLTDATRLAVTSKQRILSGETLEESRKNHNRDKDNESFSEWFKSSFIGRVLGLSQNTTPTSENHVLPINEFMKNGSKIHLRLTDTLNKNAYSITRENISITTTSTYQNAK